MESENAYISELYQAGDRLLVGVLAALAVASLALAPLHGTWWEAVAIAIPAWGTCAWLARTQPGRLVTRSAIAAALMVMATLHIHQAHGQLEAHFEIFVLLAFLLYYRDWQPVVVAAGVVAVLHLSFDLMQRGGLPVWVFASSGGFGIVLLHAAFVVFETALLAWMAIKLRIEISATGGDPRALASAAQELAAGNLETSIDTHGASESSLVCAMERMRTDLKATIERERIASEENSRIRTALDHIGMAALLADNDGRVVYANEAAALLLVQRAAQIRTILPAFDPGRLLGTQVADLLGAASLSKVALAALDGNETTEIDLGAAHFRVVASPVRNAAGTRLGTAVQCADRTEEIAVEVEIQKAVARATAGDLTARLDETDKQGFLRAVATGMNALVANLATVIEQVKDAAAEVHRGADELSRGNAHLSGRTEQQAQSLQETASSMGAMATTVRQNADNVSTANQLAAAARDQAEAGGGVVNQAIHAMTDINEASRKISDIIGVIDDLAFQTNLLALNAAVEAARAGEQGRGFAVVAAEVRTLAGRSASAAREIKALIQDSVRKVEGGSELVSRSGVTLEKIVVAAKRVTDIVAELAAATQEQSSGIGLVSDSLSTLDELTQQNSALVEQSAAASQSIADQARSLRESVASYHVGGPAVGKDRGSSGPRPRRQAAGA